MQIRNPFLNAGLWYLDLGLKALPACGVRADISRVQEFDGNLGIGVQYCPEDLQSESNARGGQFMLST